MVLVWLQAAVKLLNELEIADQIFRIGVDVMIVKVEQALEVYIKFILVEDDAGKRAAARAAQPHQSIIHSHNYYLMITRTIIRTLTNVTTPLRQPFGFFTNSDGAKLAAKRTNTQPTYQIPKLNIQEIVNKINDANKYFLGIKFNTNYLKVNKTIKYQQVSKLAAEKVTINDLPFEITKRQAESEAFAKLNKSEPLRKKSGQIAFSRARLEPTLLQMQKIVRQFFLNFNQRRRFYHLEPNFQVQCIKALNAFSSSHYQFKISNAEALPEVKIKNITLLKGLSAYRNDNYSTDSFEKNEQEIDDGIISYQLYRLPKEEYPQTEWFSTRRINARFQLLVKGGPTLTVLSSGAKVGSTQNVIHNIVIQTDLIPPPPHAFNKLTLQEFLRSYRLDYRELMLTNVDRKNQFYPLTYTEEEKKSILINRIE